MRPMLLTSPGTEKYAKNCTKSSNISYQHVVLSLNIPEAYKSTIPVHKDGVYHGNLQNK